MERLTALVNDMTKVMGEIEKMELALAEKKAELERIERVHIPDCMGDIETIKLRDGRTITCKTDIKASISAERKLAAHDWLEEHGFGGIIKSDIKAAFSRDDLEAARELVCELQDRGFDAELNRNVHAATLKSFIKEQLNEGTNIPLELFGVFEFKTTKITKRK